MYAMILSDKNLSDNIISRELLDELLSVEDLCPRDWEEIYLGFIKRMVYLRDKYDVLKYFYQAIEVRSDFTVANRVTSKLLKHFDELFERLPGKPPYFIPSEAGRALFESLVNPLDREEVHESAERAISVIQQLSRLYWGVRT